MCCGRKPELLTTAAKTLMMLDLDVLQRDVKRGGDSLLRMDSHSGIEVKGHPLSSRMQKKSLGLFRAIPPVEEGGHV